MNIDCVLLAGGSSKRMGEPKMLLSLDGTTLFEYVIDRHLGSSLRRVCAVVPGWLAEFNDLIERSGSERLAFVRLPRECGMSESLKTGWNHVIKTWRPDAVMISLADKPLVTPGIIDSVIGGFEHSRCRICVPVFDGRPGHPVILRADLDGEVRRLEGDRGARSLIEANRDDVCEWPVDSNAILVDVDTHDDLEELKTRLRLERD